MSELTEIDVMVITSTSEAVLVTTDDEAETWLPLSQIEFLRGSPDKKGSATIELPVWLAKEKELI